MVLACLLAGCGPHAARTARIVPQRGYADLDVLVRSHPGWPGVAQYDLALTRLRNASVRLDRPAEDAALATLPAADTTSPPSPAALVRGQVRQLEAVRQAQVARVRARRALARQRQFAPLREAWQREADAEYTQQARRAQGEYLRGVRRTLADRDAQRLNLALQIKALQDIVTGWKASTPPTPRLAQARRALAAKLVQAAQFDNARAALLRTTADTRRAAIAQAAAARDLFVQQRTTQKEAALRVQDEHQTRLFAQSLIAQEQALLHSQAAQATTPVLPAGPLQAEALPPGRTAPALSASSAAKSLRQLRMAQTRLVAQRARWIAFIYDDTRAAALDAAQKRHWTVAFAKAGPGTAFTAPLARILASQGWKT